MSNTHYIALNTLEKPQAHGHRLNAYCRRRERHFTVPLPALITAGGADSAVVGTQPMRCAAR